MTFRERIADWISGGDLVRKTILADYWANFYSSAMLRLGQQHEIKDENLAMLSKARLSLNRIAACETPKASHTVRKMAAIAREGLK